MEGKIILVIKWKQCNTYAFPKLSEDTASQPDGSSPYFLLKPTIVMNLIFALILILFAASLTSRETKVEDNSVEVSFTENGGFIENGGWWLPVGVMCR